MHYRIGFGKAKEEVPINTNVYEALPSVPSAPILPSSNTQPTKAPPPPPPVVTLSFPELLPLAQMVFSNKGNGQFVIYKKGLSLKGKKSLRVPIDLQNEFFNHLQRYPDYCLSIEALSIPNSFLMYDYIVCNMTQLIELDLGTAPIPHNIGNLLNLKILHAGHQYDGILPSSLSKLHQLQVLDIPLTYRSPSPAIQEKEGAQGVVRHLALCLNTKGRTPTQPGPKETPKASMYQWGCRDNEIIPQPTPFKGLNGFSIIQVACGARHMAILTETGTLYTEGEGIYKALGHDSRQDKSTPTLVANLKNLNITEISCGSTFTTAISDSGNVYIWGTLKWSGEVLPPSRVKCLDRIFITSISCGTKHVLALSKTGKVYSWGDNTFGQLGRNTEGNSHQIPAEIEDLKSIEAIHCGTHHSVALSSIGEIFIWGHNLARQCVPSHYDLVIPRPYNITKVVLPENDQVKKIKAGAVSTTLLTKKSALIRWGNVMVQRWDKKEVTKIPIPDGIVFEDLQVGTEHTLLLTNRGEVYSFGSCIYGQSGHSEFLDQPHLLTSLKDQRMTSIVCAGHFSFCFSGITKSILGEHLFPTFNSPKWFPDVIFHFKDDRILYSHACILASRSAMLRNQLIELKKRSPEANEVHVEISQFEYEQFEALLSYIYSDRIDFSELPSLYPLISYYSIPRLMEYIRLVQKETTSVSPSTLQIDFMNALLAEDSIITKLFGNVVFQLDEHTISTHKVFLCARSEYFNAMFERGMVEAKTNLVKITNDHSNSQFHISPENVRCLLQFLYTDKLDIDVNQAIGLLPLATQYQLERCKHLCESLIEKEVEIESVCFVYQVAKFYGAERLKVFCIRFIQENFEAIKQTEVWNNLTPQETQEISSFK